MQKPLLTIENLHAGVEGKEDHSAAWTSPSAQGRPTS